MKGVQNVNETGVKLSALISGLVTAFVFWFGEIFYGVVALVVVVTIDYLTGLLKAWYGKNLSSKIGFKGIVKKVCYFLVVAIAGVADWLMQTQYLITWFVMVFLISNEAISILENLSKIGVPFPTFLIKLLERLKETSEQKGGAINENSD